MSARMVGCDRFTSIANSRSAERDLASSQSNRTSKAHESETFWNRFCFATASFRSSFFLNASKMWRRSTTQRRYKALAKSNSANFSQTFSTSPGSCMKSNLGSPVPTKRPKRCANCATCCHSRDIVDGGSGRSGWPSEAADLAFRMVCRYKMWRASGESPVPSSQISFTDVICVRNDISNRKDCWLTCRLFDKFSVRMAGRPCSKQESNVTMPRSEMLLSDKSQAVAASPTSARILPKATRPASLMPKWASTIRSANASLPCLKSCCTPVFGDRLSCSQ
mmetsp:Transcript_128313/g.411207  ORF Transcript_128313/g.411207 Transcript_128313/m.411207 type:complete len:279 (+) Transcript_128313:1503-2339(+)